MSPLPLHISLFEWFDHNAWGHWLIAWGAFALFLAAALAPLLRSRISALEAGGPPRRRRLATSNTLFVAAVLLVFCAFRWPLWFAGPLDNPDEAEWIAGALTLRDGGLPWKHYDCHTSGPLNPATLLLTVPLGLPLDYTGARILTSLLQAAAALALWGAARRLFPEWIARLAILPAVNLWACRWIHDIGQYSSELTPVLLLTLAGWAGAVALTTSRPRVRLVLLFVAGALTTIPPFAKPQAAPLCVAFGLLLLIALLRSPAPPAPTPAARRRVQTAMLALGAATPLAIFFGYISLYGLVNQVLIFYWKSNLLYAAGRDYAFCNSLEALFDMADPIRGVAASVLGVLAFSLLTLVPSLASWRNGRGLILGAWVLVMAAFGAVIGPGRIFQHYLHFLVIPLSWLAAVSLAGAKEYLQQSGTSPRRALPGLTTVFLLITTAWPVWQTAQLYRPMNGQLYFWRERQTSPVAKRIGADTKPGDKLFVWGWSPGYHVETGIGQGAREAHCRFMIEPGPLQSHHRDRLLFDLRRNRPRWFVDAVAPGHFGYRERTLYGHDTWPELRDLIAQEYDLIDDIGGVRIYRRRS